MSPTGRMHRISLIATAHTASTLRRCTFEEQTGMSFEQFVADPTAEDAQGYLRYLRRKGYLTEPDNTKLTVEMLPEQLYIKINI
ncbi:MAG: hypothetical protein IJH40_05350 [Ruminococcus sp.]|uniref:hypothetical protein n=1 Tax=Ruminococcus sp. TaxID=41978 RepID=UPI0028731894|nr:hypothetical protein [Ruminococcus sp.]MBQ3285053.1 hypothetical protein [Ruminococcus sp.]